MTPPLALGRADGRIYRVARGPDAWAWPEWAYAHEDGTFENRFDDPRGEYRVLYASSQREGAFAETLARYRVDLQLAAEYQLIKDDPEDSKYPDAIPGGVVPREWLDERLVGTAAHGAWFVDLGHSDSLAHLRPALADRVLHFGLDDLDAGAIRGAPRAFTQEISRYVFEQGRDDAGQAVAGARYLSRVGDEFVNWAVFEPNDPSDPRSDSIDADDADLLAIFERFELRWG